MPSERIAKALRDIVEAIAEIQEWVLQAGGIEEAVFRNKLVRAAIERKLLIISEAAIRIDHDDPTDCPTHAGEIEWRGMRGIGNILRHRYDDLDTQVILGVLQNRLGPLEAACQRLLAVP